MRVNNMEEKIMTEVNEKRFVIDTNLDMVTFISVVNGIAVEYFDADGTYTPHIGMLNAMRVFYNECVKESPYSDTVPFPIQDAIEMKEIVKDEEFIEAFNKTEWPEKLDFSTAYQKALEIVDYRKTSLASLVELVQNAVMQLAEKLNTSLSDERLAEIGSLVEKLGGDDAKKVMEALGQINKK